MPGTFTKFVPSSIGVGAFDAIADTAKGLGISKVMLVYDPFLPDAFNKAVQLLEKDGIGVVSYSVPLGEPTDESVEECARQLHAAGGVDGIIGLGGGAALDTAKGCNCLANNPPPLADYSVNFGTKVAGNGLPMILMPSTSGTGSECSWVSVITFPSRGSKASIRSMECCLASYAIIDPEITMGMPPALTANTGIDALCHACESMTISPEKNLNPISDALAKEAIRIVVKYLPIAYKDGKNAEARAKMGAAATMAGMAFTNAMNHLPHAFGHSLGATLHLPHGYACGQALPIILNYIADVQPVRLAEVAECLGVTLPENATPEQIGKAVGEFIIDFYAKLDFQTLKDKGYSLDECMKAADLVQKDACYPFTPKTMDMDTIKKYIEKIYNREL